MKRLLIFAALAVFLLPAATVSAQGIFWDGGTIPDPLFREYVLAKFDTDHNGRISKAEADAVTAMILSDPETGEPIWSQFTPVGDQRFIWSLKGVEYFPNLKILHVVYHKFSFSELSANTKLEELSFGGLPLDFNTPPTAVLDLSGFKALKKLSCSSFGEINSGLDLSANTALTSLDCRCANITTLILPKTAPYLTEIDCGENHLTTLNVSGYPALRKLKCFDNQIPALDLTKNLALEELNCFGNRFTSLDLSANTALVYIGCSDLKSLILPKTAPRLNTLHCSSSEFASLDLSNYPSLRKIDCGSMDDLRVLNLSNLRNLEEIYFSLGHYVKNRDLTIIINSMTKTPPNLKEYLNTQEERRVRIQQEQEAKEIAAAAVRARVAESKRQVVAYISRNDWEGADRFAASALANLPCGDAYLYFVRAKAYYKRNLDFGADPNENVSSYFKAYQQEATKLLSLCNNSISCDRSDSNEAYLLRGFAYTILGQANDAAADFRRYMAGIPTAKALCYYNIGVVFKNAKWWKDALDNFKLARQYYTDKKDIDQCLTQIKSCQEKMDGK